MDNGMENMLDMYLFETNSLLEQLDEILLEAEKSQTFTMDDVNEIFRIMHTLKGSSAMMEFSSIMKIAHKIEDLFFLIRENGVAFFEQVCKEAEHQELFNLLFKSIDFMRSEVEKVETNQPLSDNIDSYIVDINTFLNKITPALKNLTEGGEGVTVETTTKAPTTETATEKNNDILSIANIDKNFPYYVQVYFENGCGMENLRAFMLATTVKEVCENLKYFPADVESNPDTANTIIEQGFFLAFPDQDSLEKAVGIVKNAINVQTYEVIENTDPPVEEKVSPKQEPAAEHKTTQPKQTQTNIHAASGTAPQPAAKQSLISVNLSKLDNLVAIVGEIVITESMVTASPEIQGMKLDSFTKSARQLRKLTDELQDIAMSIRMVPVSGVFQKMNRIVRDMSQKLGKNVKLTIIGEDTEVDKTIVDGIGDPIMHIVRNSMDHGIEETPEERIQNGKDPQGEIILSAQHTGSEVIITVEDDGQGMDTSKILEKAKNNGILTKPESEYSKKEILSLLMIPGFSTNEEVTEYSGRGVGMDVVRKNVEKVGGTVTITSEMGQGSCITLKIPLTLAIVDGMEIAVGKSIFTIPIVNIRQSFKVNPGEVVRDASRGEIIEKMGEFYPIIRVHELYNIETEITNIEDGIIVWVESGDKSYCLFVDELLGEQQVVVKPLPVYLNSFNIKNCGISGCTILGDGNISIILDILNLYTAAHNIY